jgi:hypothetical protein
MGVLMGFGVFFMRSKPTDEKPIKTHDKTVKKKLAIQKTGVESQQYKITCNLACSSKLLKPKKEEGKLAIQKTGAESRQ